MTSVRLINSCFYLLLWACSSAWKHKLGNRASGWQSEGLGRYIKYPRIRVPTGPLLQMKIKAIIFDLWGTLAYTEPHIGKFIEDVNKLLAKEHVEVFTKLRRQWYTQNISSDSFFSNLIEETKLNPKKKHELIEVWEEQTNHAKLYPETLEILQNLKENQIKLALISNTTPITEQAMKKLAIEKYFDCILYSHTEGVKKPDKKLFQRALEKLKVKSGELLIVGDQLTTDKAGADSIGVNFILLDRENKTEYKDKINNLKELTRIIK